MLLLDKSQDPHLDHRVAIALAAGSQPGPTCLALELSLQRGECVAVMGAPGSGKSALLLALLGAARSQKSRN